MKRYRLLVDWAVVGRLKELPGQVRSQKEFGTERGIVVEFTCIPRVQTLFGHALGGEIASRKAGGSYRQGSTLRTGWEAGSHS